MMSKETIQTLKCTFPPLYVTNATKFHTGPTSGTVDAGEAFSAQGSYSGEILDSSGWISPASTVGPGTGSRPYTLVVYNEQEVDLMGLFAQGISLAPLGASTQRTEPPATGSRMANDAYMREFVVWTTLPLSSGDRAGLIQSFSPVPPYAGNAAQSGSLTTSQVIAGYSKTYANSDTIDHLVGFLVEIGSGDLGFMDMISAPKLYCTRLVYMTGTLKDDASRFQDIPFSCEILGVAQTEPDELEQFTQMARSLDPPVSD